MGESYFIWNGIDSRTKGIIMQGPAPIIIPEERVKHTEVPGRAGDLTQIETRNAGEGAYNSYIQTVRFTVEGEEKIKEIANWLRWNGYVTFSTDPDKKQPARPIGAVTMNRYSHNKNWYEGEVQFYCQPLKEKLTEEPIIIYDNSHPLLWHAVNNGDVWARPLIKMITSGTSPWICFTRGEGASRRINIDMTGLSNQTIYIDCETMEVYNSDKTSILTSRAAVTGQRFWPLLYSGDNAVTGDGWSQVEITKRERFL